MSDKDSAQNVIDSYRKRRQSSMPFLIGALAVLLVAVGIVIIIVYAAGPEGLTLSFGSTDTPTPTVTATATATFTLTPTATASPTVTVTPTATASPTASGPFVYTVEENDNLFSIAEKFGVDVLVLMALNNFGSDTVIRVGDEILIPPPDLALPTSTPLPAGMTGLIDYTIASGDNLEGIASRFNSTVDSILKENPEVENANDIFVGQVIKVRVNIATPIPTRTPGPGATLTQQAQPSATSTP